MTYYTIYQSIPSDKVTTESIDAITQESIIWNSKHGVTGILIHHENQYLQYLEGAEKDVKEVFHMIKGDPRHHSIERKVAGFTDERVFSEWSMGSWLVGSEKPDEISILKNLENYIADPINSVLESKKYISLMHGIMRSWIELDKKSIEELTA